MTRATETKPATITKAHPFPWRVRAPVEFMSEEHDVVDATGSVVINDVDSDTAKALLDVTNYIALSQLTAGYFVHDLNASNGPLLLEPGAIYELAPGEEMHGPDTRAAKIERMGRALERARNPQWDDDQFEIWWNRDPWFVERVNNWNHFGPGTGKQHVLWEAEQCLNALEARS